MSGYECHLPDRSAAIHSRYSSASSLNFAASGSDAWLAFSSHSAAFFLSSEIVAPAGIIFCMTMRIILPEVLGSVGEKSPYHSLRLEKGANQRRKLVQ